MDLPELWMQHSAALEVYLGTDGFGNPAYDPTFTMVCFQDDKRRLVRGPTGDEVVSETTLYAQLGPSITVNSRVTLADGRVARVLQVLARDGGDLPTPSHLEIILT